MKKNNYKEALSLFVQEIKRLEDSQFINPDDWVLDKGLLNGVLIGYSITKPSHRLLIHNIGLKYELIPLCPEDVVDLDYSTGETRAVVVTRFGRYLIPKKTQQSLLN